MTLARSGVAEDWPPHPAADTVAPTGSGGTASHEAASVPVTYEISGDPGLIRTRCTGAVSFREVLDHFRALETDPSLPGRLDVLLDLAETTSLPESDQLRSIAGRIEQLLGRVRWGACAIVAKRDALFGMSRMFEVFSGSSFVETKVFREVGEAEAWLTSTRGRGATA